MRKKDAENNIQQIVDSLNENGKGIPRTVLEIEDFPYSDFSSLIADLKAGKAKLLRFAFTMESSLFGLIATSGEKFKNTLGLIISYGGIIAVIVAAYFYTWWLLASIPVVFIIGSTLVKNSYNNAILNSAYSSELLFCFMYFSGQISVKHQASNRQYFHERV
jgi:hypothetical protein